MTVSGMTNLTIYSRGAKVPPLQVYCVSQETNRRHDISHVIVSTNDKKTVLECDFSELAGSYMLTIADNTGKLFEIIVSTPLINTIYER
jgi:hypothetical protein